MDIEIMLGDAHVGNVTYDQACHLFSFAYDEAWLKSLSACALSPLLPLNPPENTPAELHSAIVRQFFENLLPEGQALDVAAIINKVSKSNVAGLMIALGKETAGAIRIRLPHSESDAPESMNEPFLRPITDAELSSRIRQRPEIPFSVWDGKFRLSIAGFQDKIAAYKHNSDLLFVDGGPYASTVILKPEPTNSRLVGLTSNEFFCMRLASKVGVKTAEVSLRKVPDPILEVARFDREILPNGVKRIHVIDGCQALGMPPGHKYERNFGNAFDVRNIREGASLPKLFKLLSLSKGGQAIQKMALLRWTIFQVLVGNTDAHGKNVSFFMSPTGLVLTPAYDIVSALAYPSSIIEHSFAFAIGDAFHESELSPYEWAHFAHNCGLPRNMVATEVGKIAAKVLKELGPTSDQVSKEGADMEMVSRVCEVAKRIAMMHAGMSDEIKNVNPKLFS